MKSTDILIGRQAIMDWIGIISPDVFYDFVRAGLQARVINKRWYAHEDNLSMFFRAITRCPCEVDEDAE